MGRSDVHWAVRNVERADVNALVSTRDGDVLSTTDMRLGLDWFIVAKLSGFGIDFFEQLSERGPPVTAAIASELVRT